MIHKFYWMIQSYVIACILYSMDKNQLFDVVFWSQVDHTPRQLLVYQLCLISRDLETSQTILHRVLHRFDIVGKATQVVQRLSRFTRNIGTHVPAERSVGASLGSATCGNLPAIDMMHQRCLGNGVDRFLPFKFGVSGGIDPCLAFGLHL